MIVVNVLYSAASSFDETYYLTTHMPMVREGWADQLAQVRVMRGVGDGGGGEAGYRMIAELSFATMADLGAAMGGPAASGIMGDIANFTDGQPTLQVSEVVD